MKLFKNILLFALLTLLLPSCAIIKKSQNKASFTQLKDKAQSQSSSYDYSNQYIDTTITIAGDTLVGIAGINGTPDTIISNDEVVIVAPQADGKGVKVKVMGKPKQINIQEHKETHQAIQEATKELHSSHEAKIDLKSEVKASVNNPLEDAIGVMLALAVLIFILFIFLTRKQKKDEAEH